MATKAEIKAYLDDRLPDHPYWQKIKNNYNYVSLKQIREEREYRRLHQGQIMALKPKDYHGN